MVGKIFAAHHVTKTLRKASDVDTASIFLEGYSFRPLVDRSTMVKRYLRPLLVVFNGPTMSIASLVHGV